jgi:hypothetical protein
VKGAHRSGCPINLTLEMLGDRWSLIVIRDIMFGNRRHYIWGSLRPRVRCSRSFRPRLKPPANAAIRPRRFTRMFDLLTSDKLWADEYDKSIRGRPYTRASFRCRLATAPGRASERGSN